MKENDPLIVMTHTLIENSAPRPQLYQQVRPAKGFAPPHPHQSLLWFWFVVQCSSSGVEVPIASWDWSPCILCIASTSSSIAFDCSPVITRSHANMVMTCKIVVWCVCFTVQLNPSLTHRFVCVGLDIVYSTSWHVFRKHSASCRAVLNQKPKLWLHLYH